MELLDRHSEGVIALTGCLQSRFCRRLVEDRPADARAHARRPDRGLRPRAGLLRDPAQRDPRAGEGQRGDRALSPASSAGRWSRPPTSTTCGARTTTTTPRCSACRRSRRSSSRSSRFDTNEFYLKSPRRWRSRSRRWPEAVPTTLEIAERCELEIELGKLLLPRYPTAGRRGAAGRCCAGSRPRACAAATATRRPPRRSSGSTSSSAVISEMGFESYFLIVWDFVSYAKDERDRRRPGPRLGGGLDRRLRARDHRPRSARQRPAVRALPQPGAQVDAGHRHRLLGPRPRAGDPLRRRTSTAASRSPRSSPSARWRRARRPATRRGCSASTTRPATASRS